MKMAYIANTGLAESWAHSVQIMNMCNAFAKCGVDVTLIVPKRNSLSEDEIFSYYDLPKNFAIRKIPFLDFFSGTPNKLFYFIRFISFYISARLSIIFKDYDILYSRDFFSVIFFPNIVLEQHSFPKKISLIHKVAISLTRKFVVLTSFIKDKYIKNKVNENDVLVAPDAVDVDNFIVSNDSPAISKKKEDYIFGYVGTLKTMGEEKGVGIAIESLKYLSGNFKFLVVGGEKEDVEFYKEYAKDLKVEERVIFIGKILRKYIPDYISQCDCVVAPFPENEHYSFYMSPLKIFEYMASKKPIITTDLPSIKEVLENDRNAVLIEPSNPKSLAEAIIKIKENPVFAIKISNNAYNDVVSKYTWDKRAENIFDFVKK